MLLSLLLAAAATGKIPASMLYAVLSSPLAQPAPPAPPSCFKRRNDWLGEALPFFEYIFGNLMTIGIIGGAGSLLIGGILLMAHKRSERASGVIQWIVRIFGGLAVILFGVTFLLGIAFNTPTGC